MLLREIPKWDKPREKVLKNGINSLSNIELLALILRTGTKGRSALELAQDLLYRLPNLKALTEQTIKEITDIKGLGQAKAIGILASIEFAKRIINEERNDQIIDNPKLVYDLFKNSFIGVTQEELLILFLNTKGRLITSKMISRGSLNSINLNPRELLKWAIKLSAPAIILIHNHPSGDPTPSDVDIETTREIIYLAKTLDIIVLDHIIIGDTYYSMQRELNIFHRSSKK